MALRKGLVLAMEDADYEESDLDVADTQVGMDEASEEVSGDLGEADDLSAAIEEAEADAETLGQISDVMEDSVESGEGMNETAAEIAEIAVEAICNRLGIRGRSVFPATESFGSSNSRVQATRIAMEGIGDYIKKIWEAIKAAIKRLWDKIKSFFMGITKNAKKLTDHLEALKKRVQDLPSGATPAEKDLENESLAKKFSDNNQANLGTAEAILGRGVKLLEADKTIMGEISTLQSAIKSASASITDAAKAGEKHSQVNSLTKELHNRSVAALKQLGNVTDFDKTKGPKGDKETVKEAFGPFFNSQILVASVSKNAAEVAGGGEGTIRWSLGFEEYDKKIAKKIKALTPAEMTTLLSKAIDAADELVRFEKLKSETDKVNKLNDEITETMLKQANAIAEEKDPKVARLSKQYSSSINDVQSTLAKLSLSFPGILFNTINGIGEYVSASIANCKQKEKSK